MKTPQFTLMDVMMADPLYPMPVAKRNEQLVRMRSALSEIEQSPDAKPDHWRVLSDAVNLLETMCELGHMSDDAGLLQEASSEMHAAAIRYSQGKPLRLSGHGIQAMRAVIEDYESAIEQLPERVVIQAHRATEKRIREIQSGKTRAHDVVVTSL